MTNDNIVALSTAFGASGVAVIRISGDSPLSVVEKMFKPQGKTQVKDFVPYMMYTGEFDGGNFYDYGMCVYFKAPKSYTGEDVVEIHCHGGNAIVKGLLRKAVQNGARLATRGEFTKRAFMNGKLYVAMCNNSSILDINASKPISEETMKVLETQILLPAMIINELGLNDKKYNEGDAI